MDAIEYAKLERIDREHWFYRGKRAIVRHWIERYLSLSQDDLYIDAGCGTGTMLTEMNAQCRVVGLDNHDESIALSQAKLDRPDNTVLKTDLKSVELADGCAAVVTMLDVLEHLDNDEAALEEMIRLTKPGGLIVITVPAMQALWNDWDVALHHRRRYSKSGLLRLVQRSDVEVLRCAYMNVAALPAIVMIRAWRKLRPPAPDATRAEDRVPGKLLNMLLLNAFVLPARWRWCLPPCGVSLLAVLRRQGVPIRRRGRNVQVAALPG